ncbi:two-component regulator propeller domain-containing protein [Acanthopleuribacter pedis]|uniref:histidine kinase n=1 Tax=Acanthopleuribacter pedis TaxID=442870 RepID=A0A8J7U6V6_9BACT|nr:two-component regulator propeller domain-containing protein [Acanthopleuribacter pedis]MBO1322334.1 response regulator [Acanthopleuribacter pedis]
MNQPAPPHSHLPIHHVLFVLWCAFAWTLAAVAQPTAAKVSPDRKPLVQRLVYPEPLPDIAAIIQDRTGFLWFGHMGGLSRYDGLRYKHYRHDGDDPGSLVLNEISCLLLDAQGRLWVGSKGGLHQYLPAFDHFERLIQAGDPRATHTKRINRIFSLAEAAHGGLWVGSDAGLFHFAPQTRAFTPVKLPLAPQIRQRIKAVQQDQDGGLWVGLSNRGIFHRAPDGRWRNFAALPEQGGLRHLDINAILVDRHKQVWVTTLGGLHRYDPDSARFQVVPRRIGNNPGLPEAEITYIAEAGDRRYWVGTGSSGLVHYNAVDHQFTAFQHTATDANSLPAGRIRSLFVDRSQILWVGTRDNVAKINPATARFGAIRARPGSRNALHQNNVGPMAWDNADNLWISLAFTGLQRFHEPSNQWHSYLYTPEAADGFPTPEVFSITVDAEGRPWFGTTFAGLMTWDSETDRFTRHKNYGPDDPLPRAFAIMELLVDSRGFIWCGTNGAGVSYYDRDSNRFFRIQDTPDQPFSTGRGSVRAMAEDPDGYLWLAFMQEGVLRLHGQTGNRSFFQRDPQRPRSLRHDIIHRIKVCSDGRVWLGTADGLSLYQPESNDFRHFTPKHGLPGQEVYAIEEDRQGYLWLGTNGGLARFDPRQHRFLNFDVGDGLLNRAVSTGLVDPKGRLYFGGTNGINRFFPKHIRANPYPAEVALTDFKIFNTTQVIGAGFGLDQHINLTDQLRLTYREPVFSFEFAALEYTNPTHNRFAVKMDGFDKSWRDLGRKSDITYTNLDPGSYRLHVKAANNDGLWHEREQVLTLHIAAPPWKSTWAYTLYILLVILALWGYVRWTQHRLALEKEAVLRLRRLDRLKDEFLANTSHELRTPLHGITGLADSLLDGRLGELPAEVDHNLRMIRAGGKRLLTLVNDLLDFSRMEHVGLQLHYQQVHLHALVDVVFTLTKPLAGGKQLELLNEIDPDSAPIPADENRLQQILTNLIGNAVKFTEQGSVRVHAQEQPDGWRVMVTDTGIGIAPNKQQQIFESFQQADGSITRLYGGTGLGLAITRRLVASHGGELGVDSALGQGSTFWFTLPRTVPEEAATVERHQPPPIPTAGLGAQRLPDQIAAAPAAEPLTTPPAFEETRPFTVLVVDDEPVNQQVVINYLAPFTCEVVTADHGKAALRLLEEKSVDLVLLDVMMPGLSGFDVCRRIRESYSAARLPIIFLTAKNQVEDMVIGFRLGANDYLGKPFSREELLARALLHLKLAGNHAAVQRLRTQIASDLHDDIGAILTRLTMAAEWIGQVPGLGTKVHKKAGRIAELSRSVVQSFSDLVWSIDARNDSSRHLVVKLRETAAQLLPDIPFEMTVDDAWHNTGVSPEVRRNLYLIFKEALNNLVKYADADQVTIALGASEGRFVLCIADNGSGFDATTQRAGHGLRNMHMRAERLGGTCSIQSGEQGTRIEIRVPPT